MTDINRHLPKIFKTLKIHLRSNISATQAELRQLLTDFLPASYGVGTGRVVNKQGQSSQPLEIILYDKTLIKPTDPPITNVYPLHQVLAAFEISQTCDEANFNRMLKRLASLKMLKAGVAKPASRTDPDPNVEQIPKELLPLGVLMTNGQTVISGLDTAGFCLELDQKLRNQVANLRPDSLFFLQDGLTYRNPLLDGQDFSDATIGFSREPVAVKIRACYVCKARYYRRHFFYEALCQFCGDFNYRKRLQTRDLSGQLALVTGARIKIGYAVALSLLRADATVIATSRFPHDTALRYSKEADFAHWQHRLHVYGLDLRSMPSLEAFLAYLNTAYPQLDILVNNAAQTIWRPSAFYAHLLPFEALSTTALPAPLVPLLNPHLALPKASEAALLPLATFGQNDDFPFGQYDRDGQQLDKRVSNSWVTPLEDLSVNEMLEVQLVNAIAPSLLIGRLKPLMLKSPNTPRYIINVSALEGQFVPKQFSHHPHTNMAKAALNMLTHTIAADYATDNILINSVDPGWISQQVPNVVDQENSTPLDQFDAAARICDPIFAQSSQYGKFFKDYCITDW